MVGPLFHARWLTLAARVLRLYFSMEPGDLHYGDIRRLVLYIVKVYFKTHMQIKVLTKHISLKFIHEPALRTVLSHPFPFTGKQPV